MKLSALTRKEAAGGGGNVCFITKTTVLKAAGKLKLGVGPAGLVIIWVPDLFPEVPFVVNHLRLQMQKE